MIRETVSLIGSILTAAFSSACCLGPAAFALIGAGAGTAGALGGVAGFIKALIPYRPLFMGLAVGFLALGFVSVYGRGRRACSPAAARRLRFQKVSLWVTAGLVVLLMASPYLLGL